MSQKSSKRARLPAIRSSIYRPDPSLLPDPPPTESSSASGSTKSWITTVKKGKYDRAVAFDNKVIHSKTSPSTGSSPNKSSPPDSGGGHGSLGKNGNASKSREPTSQKRKHAYTVKSKLVQWLDLRDSTLDELLRHDGRASFTDHHCSQCQQEKGSNNWYRCRDCGHGTARVCKTCLLSKHSDLPLHRTEHWNGQFFEKAPLSTLGLRIQLGHDGRSCPCPTAGPSQFLVFDVSGAHHINIDYCGCNPEKPKERYIQLLRTQWFPAMTIRPQTAFMFNCLDTFHESTLQGKGNLYDFYHTLLRKTDNANIDIPIYRFPEIHRAFRLWRNMMAWKRAGRGQDPSGISGTAPGGVVVECPACPHPGQNLPDNWMDAGPLLFLYTLFIAVDANFKLKGKDRKLDDVDLVPGTGIFVEDSSYQKHILNYTEQPEISTCQSEHDAIVRASIRSTPGYAVSGVGLVLCSRHSLVRKNGVGDLQKGERYCNIDFIVLSALLGVASACVFITYDIACQFSKYFKNHMLEFPEKMRIADSTQIKMAIPSWHINGHGPSCRTGFCLGYTKGVGRTCGEEVEIAWSHTNPLAPSVREMAAAARRDALSDHWNGWNFRKTVGFGPSFSRKLKEAAQMQKKHQDIHDQFTATFKAALIKKWEKEIEKWECNPKSPNPYVEPDNAITLQDIRLELSKEETAAAEAGKVPQHKVSMTGFLVTGMDLEMQQYKLRVEVAKRKTTKNQADIQDKRTVLLRQIHNWRQSQLVYTPHAAVLIAASSAVDESGVPRVEMAENIPLYLPSSLPTNIQSSAEMSRVCNMEIRLRRAAASDALSEVRRGRRNVTKLWKYKKVNVSGTGNRPNTRMLTLYDRLSNKIERAAEKYRRARAALMILDPKGTWQEELKELRKEDVRGPGKDSDDKALDEVLEAALGPGANIKKKPKSSRARERTSNGRFEESWIWLVQRKGKGGKSEDDEFGDDMRVEWAKSRARLMRWKEEFLLVKEEMRRVIEWYEWRAVWWEKKALERKDGDQEIMDGVVAYSHKQASLVRKMAQRCAEIWIPVLEAKDKVPDWASRYPISAPGRKKRLAGSAKGIAHDNEHKDGDAELSDEDDSVDGKESQSESDASVEVDEVDDDFVFDD